MSVLTGAGRVAVLIVALVVLISGIRLLIASGWGSLCAGSLPSLTGTCTGGASSPIGGAARATGAAGTPFAPDNAPRVDDSSARSAP